MVDVVQTKKRKRSPNWEDEEKCLLRECVKDKLDIIENKCTDTNTNKSKEKVWQNVFQCFNELNSKPRTLIELKQQWRTMKFDAKKCNSPIKIALEATGVVAQKNVEEKESSQIKIDDCIISQECQTAKNKEIPYGIKRKIIESTSINKRRKRNQKINEDMALSESKNSRDTVFISFLQKEHDLKMKHMAETHLWAQKEHEQKMKNLILKNMILEKQLLQLIK